MAGLRRVSKELIVQTARAIVSDQGVPGLTFQRIASALGVTKQAIIYWYPSKNDLARDLMFPLLAGEAEATMRAVAAAETGDDAIGRFVRSLIDFHLRDLGGFRLIYLAGQIDGGARALAVAGDTLGEVHRTTAPMYAALEAKLARDPGYSSRGDSRQLAVACHMAGVGLLTMVALGQSLNDPLAHGTGPLIDAMVALLTARPMADLGGPMPVRP